MKKRLIIMASGNGGNFEAIVKHVKEEADIKLITDNPEAMVINRAIRLKIPYVVIDRKLFPDKKRFDENIFYSLKSFSPDLVALAGYMRILPTEIVEFFKDKIVNIHPSLLPAFKGKDAIRKAFDYGVKYTGVTVHLVDEKIDHGEIIDQIAVRIEENMSLKELEKKIHKAEHRLYSKIIKKLLAEEGK